MKKADLMKTKASELPKTLESLKKKLFNLNSSSLAGEDSQKKKAQIKAVKKDIARVKTRLNNNI